MQTCHINTKLEKKLLGFNYLAIFFSFLFELFSFMSLRGGQRPTWQSPTLMYIIPFFLFCGVSFG